MGRWGKYEEGVFVGVLWWSWVITLAVGSLSGLALLAVMGHGKRYF